MRCILAARPGGEVVRFVLNGYRVHVHTVVQLQAFDPDRYELDQLVFVPGLEVAAILHKVTFFHPGRRRPGRTDDLYSTALGCLEKGCTPPEDVRVYPVPVDSKGVVVVIVSGFIT